MLQGKHFRLVTLGRLTLLRPDGSEEESLVKRRRKLAVLTLLALSPRPITRDRLALLFWGEQDDDRARHSLADTLSHLRRILGKDAIAGRQEEVSLEPAAALEVDVADLRRALAEHDPVRACELYAGPFLDGVHVERSPEFSDWADQERTRLAREFTRAAAEACAIHARAGAEERRAEVARRWLEAEPLADDAAVHRLEALAAAGTREALGHAVAEFERLTQRLRRDFDLAPGPRASALGAALRERLAAAAAGAVPAEAALPVAAPTPPSRGAAAPHRRRWLGPALVGVGALVLVAVAAALRTPARAATDRPVIALGEIRLARPDPGREWLADGLGQMISAELSRNTQVDVVAPERVRELLARASRTDDPLAPAAQADLGRRLGADWVVTGALTAGDTGLVLELDLVDVAHDRLGRVLAVSSGDPISLADGASARLLDVLDATGPGPHLAAVETSNLEAYQLYLTAERATQEGRLDVAFRDLDRAIALDSGFVSAVLARLDLARGAGDWAGAERLEALFQRKASRASAWDRASEAARRSLHAGERARSEALGRALVAQFPRDPRGYALLAEILMNHGRWDAADTVLRRELALDSLALEAGNGPCAPCVAYAGLEAVRLTRGDIAGAEQAAFRWVGLQPELPVAWDNLSTALSYAGRFPEAIDAEERAMTLSRADAGSQERMVRTLLMARAYRAVDSALAAWKHGPGRPALDDQVDIAALALREHGRYRAALALMDRAVAAHPGIDGALVFMRANTLTRLGRPREAAALLARVIATGPSRAGNGDEARAIAWHYALKASAIAAAGDTLALAAIADSIGRVAEGSYYGRDWLLPAAVRGMIAADAGRWGEAAADLQQGRWGVAGWTELNALLAEAYLHLGCPDSAVAVVRAAYAAPLDAMGRYEPRSELDYEMAKAFTAAGQRDSAAAYVGRLRTAWADADPEVRERLTALVAESR